MQHARKMVLVPESSYMKNEQNEVDVVTRQTEQDNPVKSVQTQGTVMTRLDTEMRDILSASLPEDEKWKAYEQVLRRYLFNVRKPTTVANNGLPGTDVLNNDVLPLDIIVDAVPVKYRTKAKLLVNFLMNSHVAARLSWNTQGTVSIDGKVIPHSNVIDLVNDVMRSRKSFQAVGRDVFATLIRESDIPLEFIGNPFFTSSHSKGTYTTSTPQSLYKTTGSSRNYTSLDDSFADATLNNTTKQQEGRGWLSMCM